MENIIQNCKSIDLLRRYKIIENWINELIEVNKKCNDQFQKEIILKYLRKLNGEMELVISEIERRNSLIEEKTSNF